MHACQKTHTQPGFPAPNSHKTARERNSKRTHTHIFLPSLAHPHLPTPSRTLPGGVMTIDRTNNTLEPPALSLGDLAWGAGDLLRRGLGWAPPFRPGYERRRPRPDEHPPSLSHLTHLPSALAASGPSPLDPIALRQMMDEDEERESAGIHGGLQPSSHGRDKILRGPRGASSGAGMIAGAGHH